MCTLSPWYNLAGRARRCHCSDTRKDPTVSSRVSERTDRSSWCSFDCPYIYRTLTRAVVARLAFIANELITDTRIRSNWSIIHFRESDANFSVSEDLLCTSPTRTTRTSSWTATFSTLTAKLIAFARAAPVHVLSPLISSMQKVTNWPFVGNFGSE